MNGTREDVLAYYRRCNAGWPSKGDYDGLVAAMEEDSLIHYDDKRWTIDAAYPVIGVFYVDGWIVAMRSYNPRYIHYPWKCVERFTARLQDFKVVDEWYDSMFDLYLATLQTPCGDKVTTSDRRRFIRSASREEHGTIALLRKYCPAEQQELFETLLNRHAWNELADLVATYAERLELGKIPVPA